MKVAFTNFIFLTIIALTIIGCSDTVNNPKPTDIIKLAATNDGAISMTGQRSSTNNVAFTIQQLDETGAITFAPIPAGRIFVTGFKSNNSPVVSSLISVNIKLPSAFTPGEKLPVYINEVLTWKAYQNFAIVSSTGKEATLQINSLLPFIIVSNLYKIKLNNDFSLATVAEVNSGTGDFTWTAGKTITPSLSLIKKSAVSFENLTSAPVGDFSAASAIVANNDTWLIRTVKNGVGYVYYKVKFISVGDLSAVFDFAKLQEVTGPKVLIQSILPGGAATSLASNKMMNWSDDPREISYTGTDGKLYVVSPFPGSIPVSGVNAADPAITNGAVCPNYVPGQGNALCFITGAYITDTYKNSTSLHLMKVSPISPRPDAIMIRQLSPATVGLSANNLQLPTQMSISANIDRIVGLWTSGLYGVDFAGNTTTPVRLANAAEVKNFAISPNGIYVAISKTDGKVYMRNFYGVESVVADGNWPSFNADGTKLGYMNGETYYIKNIMTNVTKSYELPYGTVWSAPALAPSTNHIIYRTSNGGMALGTLID